MSLKISDGLRFPDGADERPEEDDRDYLTFHGERITIWGRPLWFEWDESVIRVGKRILRWGGEPLTFGKTDA